MKYVILNGNFRQKDFENKYSSCIFSRNALKERGYICNTLKVTQLFDWEFTYSSTERKILVNRIRIPSNCVELIFEMVHPSTF